MASIAYVSMFNLEIICSQYGIRYSGARAVLANSVGKLMIRVIARNSMCPGTIKDRPKLRLEIVIVIRALMDIINCNL